MTTTISPHTLTKPASANPSPTGRPLIILNDDTCSLRYVDPPHDDESLLTPLRHLANSQVGAICWCMGEDIAYAWPSKVLENYYDQLDAGHWIGLVDDKVGFEGILKGKGDYYENLKRGEEPRNVMVTLHRKGIDYVPRLIDAARKLGIRFYCGFRMNDCHLKSDPRGMLASKFWREHQDWRLWEVLDGRTYYNASLDYSYPEVRQRRLDSMREVIDWYDLDGLELDFCRNPYVFQPSEAWEKRDILTEFIRTVREDLNAAEKRRGHAIDLILRVPFGDKKRREAGMDVDTWIDKRLINSLVMSCQLNDYDQLVEPWLSKCRAANIGFYPSIEQGPVHNAIHNHITIENIEETVRRQRAAAQNFIGQGASGVYMFNFPCLLFQVKRSPEEFVRLTSILSELGRPETLDGKAKQYAFWKNLPLQVESRRPTKFHQTIRFSLFDPDLRKSDTTVAISFRQATERNPHVDLRQSEGTLDILPPGWVTYSLNGKEVPEAWITREARPAETISSGFRLKPHEKLTIHPPASAVREGESTLGFFVPRYPDKDDPYIHIYELLVDVNPDNL